jgi:hypothetical protein
MFLPPPTFDFGTWWGACPERKPKDRFFARLASEIFLSSLQAEFSSTLLETIAARGPALTHARARTGSPVNYRKFPTAINPHQSHTA